MLGIIYSRIVPKKTKKRVFNAMVVPMLLHGCETWTVQRGHEKKLQSFEIDVLEKGMDGLTGMYRVRNKVVRKAIGQEAVMDMMKDKQRRWNAKWKGIK